MNKIEWAANCFSSGFNCAQAVFSSFAPELGIDEQTALGVAGGFGAGMGRLQEVCGAVSGAVMVIGCKYGKTNNEDVEAKDKTYRLVRDFTARFKQLNGTTQCRELIRCDLSTEEGRTNARENGLYEKVCQKAVRDAVSILEQLLD